MSDRTGGRPRGAETESRAYIRWINGRAYAELGAWEAWGGRRQEALAEKARKRAARPGRPPRSPDRSPTRHPPDGYVRTT